MAPNIVEKNAQALNQILRTEGKKYGKLWRSRIRELLAQTFAALNAKPLDGALCLKLSEQIEAELKAIEEGTVDVEHGAEKQKKNKTALDDKASEANKTQNDAENNALKKTKLEAEGKTTASLKPNHDADAISNDDCARMAQSHSAPGETRMAESHSGAGADAPEKNDQSTGAQTADAPLCKVPDDEIGLFDLIRVNIRCFFKINACVRPPYIGRFVRFADKFSEVVQTRIDKFIGVLDKGDEDFVAKTEVEIGYRDELIPDMPDMGLVLHPKKKKKR